MRVLISLWVSVLILISITVEACEYGDDPRLSSDKMPELVQQLISGQSVSAIKIRVGTYLFMGEHSRNLLEPHLQMFDVHCAPVGVFKGELMSRAVIPFEEFYRLMAQAIYEDRPDIAKQLFQQVRAAPITIAQMQDMYRALPYPNTHGVEMRERMQKIFPQFEKARPFNNELKDSLKDGRPQDYAMFKLYQVFGGELKFDQGCGPYKLNDSFVRIEKFKREAGEKDITLVHRMPFLHMMNAMGYIAHEIDSLTYHIQDCN